MIFRVNILINVTDDAVVSLPTLNIQDDQLMINWDMHIWNMSYKFPFKIMVNDYASLWRQNSEIFFYFEYEISLTISAYDDLQSRNIHRGIRFALLGEINNVMMTSSNGNIFRVTGHLRGEFTGHRWIPRTKASVAKLWCFLLICTWINASVHNREAGDLRRHRAHYDATVMILVD